MYGKDVRLKSLTVADDDTVVVHPADLTVAGGELLTVLGRSGAGKTSLLRAVAGLESPTFGRVVVGGVDVTDLAPGARPSVMVASEPALFAAMTVRDNVAFGLEARGFARSVRRARADDLLDRLGLADLADRRPDDLSLAERRRIALARALAIEPALILVDEPFAGLDLDQRRRLGTDLARVRAATGVTLLVATRERAEALAVSDRIAALEAGRLEQVGTPDHLYAHPATAAVARLLGEANTLDGRIVEVGRGRVNVDTALGRIAATPRGTLATGDAVEVLIRPERLRFDTDHEPAEDDGWNRVSADLGGRVLEGSAVVYTFTAASIRLAMHRPNPGLRDPLLAGLHLVGFHADDAVAFARAEPTPETRP